MDDIDTIFSLYQYATDFMRSKKTVTVWPQFDRSMVMEEISASRQFKLIDDQTVVCVWAIAFTDPQIWQERDKDKAIYIHRIASHPSYRGKNFVKIIVDWALAYTKENGFDYIRLDTIGNNSKLIEHYTRNGFEFLGLFDMKDTNGLPSHYKEGPACLFEIDIHKK
jgi:ribosomal protein S18 acetylase RimI-like enzyme